MQLQCNHFYIIQAANQPTSQSVAEEEPEREKKIEFVHRHKIYSVKIEFCQPRYGAFAAGI